MDNLHYLLSKMADLPNIGPKIAEQLTRLHLSTIFDLLLHLPVAIHNKIFLPKLSEVNDGDHIIAQITVLEIQKPSQHIGKKNPQKNPQKNPFKIICGDGEQILTIVYFNYHPEYLLRSLKHNQIMIVSGKVDRWGAELQLRHPDYFVPLDKLSSIPKLDIIYPLTYGMTSRQIHKMIQNFLTKTEEQAEWIDNQMLEQKNWPGWREALLYCHNPERDADTNATEKHRERLAYDELLAHQLSLGLFRHNSTRKPGQVIMPDFTLKQQLLTILKFDLTTGQKNAIAEIEADQQSSHRMMRLIQGDVGCGKTLVALSAMLNVIGAGKQAVLMVPTDILATQHTEVIMGILSSLSKKLILLTGKTKGKKRKQLLEEIENGQAEIIIGTHALFQEDVKFKDLALIVIDEQHRFGVEQRKLLAAKNDHADILVMSATPIPRTLTMAIYGDMDISIIKDKPLGRKPIITSVISDNKMSSLLQSLHNLIQNGEKAYWICPLIEEQEDEEVGRVDLIAAKTRFEEFNKIFPGSVGLVHGKMKQAEKEQVMNEFTHGNIKLLVATTVIEVGVDVKDASVMVIEQAERFGLSQLHQLRGRVGRGNKQSYCILIFKYPIGEVAKARLKVMRESEDGFVIAENDLKQRGAGEILGNKQSGMVNFKIANLDEHYQLLLQACEEAKNIIKKDPKLISERGLLLQNLLALYGYKDKWEELQS